MKIIGLDVGEKRIGVAKVDSEIKIATPVGFIEVTGNEWGEIAKIATLNNTNLFVLGLPRSNDGNETKQTLYVRNFAKTLATKIPDIKIRFQDESLTSVEAESRLKARGKKYVRGDIDAEAATIILQDFVENFNGVKDEVIAKTAPKSLAAKSTNKSKPKEEAPKVEAPDIEGTKKREKTPKRSKKGIEDEPKKSWFKSQKLKIFIIFIVAILAISGAIGGIIWYKDDQAKKRAEYYAWLEAQMQPEVFNFTILPGETIFDVKKSLIKLGYSTEEVETAFSAHYNFDFLASRPEGASLEGYLYGETYEFYKDSTVQEILTKFLEGTGKVIAENNLTEKFLSKGLSLYEGITLASIVQKESLSPEMPTVAQVFLSRISYGMALGSDVTVTYALNILDPNREIYNNNSAALTIDSCYNTRLYAGLPCGPISNPGLAALEAVANPSNTRYFYFLTGDDGIMYYSYTEAEHNQNAYLHCQSLCSVSL